MSTQQTERVVPADTFELRLAIARFHAGNINPTEAAMRVGVSGQTWRNWEAGLSAPARKPAMLRYIAEQLCVDEAWLRDGGVLESPRPGGPGGGQWVPWGSNPQPTDYELLLVA